MTDTAKVTATRQELAEGGLELALGVRTEVRVALTPVGMVELPVGNAAFFHPQSPIPMPEGAIPALAAAWAHAAALEDPSGIAAAHVSDKAVSQAKTLARRRAEALWCLAQGKPWPSALTKGVRPAVWHHILRWAARTFDFDCGLPEPPEASEASEALGRFRNAFNASFDASTGESGAAPGAGDWTAFAVCYQAAIAQTSGMQIQELRTKQSALRPLAGGALLCDPRWSKGARMKEYAGRAGQRVELLFFGKHCDPLVGEENTSGESIYADPNYAAVLLPFTAEDVVVPDVPVEPVEPSGPRSLYADYAILHQRAMSNLLFLDDEPAYRDLQVERETAWNDYAGMSGDEESILHEDLEVELIYRDYWMTHFEMVNLDLADENYRNTYLELYDERDALWFDYENAGGFRKTKLHTEDPPQPRAQYWQFALKHQKHHSGVNAYNLALLSEAVYRPQDKAPEVLFAHVKGLGAPGLGLAEDLPRLEKEMGDFPALYEPSQSPYGEPLSFSDSKTNTQGICFTNESHAVLIFRGTENVSDWMRNFAVDQDSFLHTDLTHDVHKGFQDGLETKLDDGKSRMQRILAFLRTTIRNRNPVFIAGHSLGGALATYAACALRALEPGLPITLYTFGQPRLCNRSMAAYFLGSFTYYRYAHKGDVVPLVPVSSTLRALTTYEWNELDTLFHRDFGDYYAQFGSHIEAHEDGLKFKASSVETIDEASYLEYLKAAWSAPSALPSHDMGDTYLFHAYAWMAKGGAPSKFDEQLARVREAAATHWQLDD